MKKILIFEDGYECELSPITFDEFEKYGKWSGCSDTAFRYFLRHNDFHELASFNEDEVRKARIELRGGDPNFDWEIIYGDE